MNEPSFAGYEVLGVLGRGGMGVVYKARQLGLNRIVAIKMILAGSAAGTDEIQRFRAKAEAVARLQHPHIVQEYRGKRGGRPSLFLSGVCRRQQSGGRTAQRTAIAGGRCQVGENPGQGDAVRPRAGHYPSRFEAGQRSAGQRRRGERRETLRFPGRLGTALPSQASLADAFPLGNPKIADFGLAKQLDSDSGQTASGAVIGTPSYMAPEQADGRRRDIGPTADVYSLGASCTNC